METFLDSRWALLPVSIGLLYLFGLPLLLLTMRESIDLALVPVDDDVPLPESVGGYLADVSAGMSQIGFEQSATVFVPQKDDDVTAIWRLFINEGEQDRAVASTFYTTIGGEWKVQTQYLEFSTSYEDSTMVDTRNNGIVGAYPTPPQKTETMAPWFSEPAELYEAHRKVCQLVAGRKRKQCRLHSDFHGDAVAELAAECRETYERAEEAGYLHYIGDARDKRPDDDGSATGKQARVLKPTVKGAYLMAWKFMWPFKRIVAGWHLKRSRQRLERAEVEVKK